MIWEFTLHIKDLAEFTDELTDRLYEAGCGDGTLSSSKGHSQIGFSREADSMEQAIRSAIADLHKCDLTVVRAEIDEESLSQLVE